MAADTPSEPTGSAAADAPAPAAKPEAKPAAKAAASAQAASPAAPALKKGALVRLNASAWAGSLEAAASDARLPDYLTEGPGEILAVKGDYAQLRWRRPVPDVWLRLDQLEAWSAG